MSAVITAIKFNLTDEQVKQVKKFRKKVIRENNPSMLLGQIYFTYDGAFIIAGEVPHSLALKLQELMGIEPNKRVRDAQ